MLNNDTRNNLNWLIKGSVGRKTMAGPERAESLNDLTADETNDKFS